MQPVRARFGHPALLTAVVTLVLCACGGDPDTNPSGANGGPAELPPCSTPAGAPTTLYQGQVTGLAVRDDQIFIADWDRIVEVPISGGSPAVVAVPGSVYGLALLNDRAYYTGEHSGPTDPQGKQSSESTLDSVPLAGGAPATVLSTPPPTSEGMLVSDESSLYMGGRVTPSGSAVAKLTPPDTTLIDLPLDGKVFVYAIAVHAGYVYVAAADMTQTGLDNGVVERVPTSSGSAQILLTGIGHPTAIAVDDSGLYLALDPLDFNGSPGKVVRAKLDGSAMTTLLDSNADSLALAGGELFVSKGDEIVSVPVAGGSPRAIAQGGKSMGMLRVAGGNLVWLDPVVKAMSDTTVPVAKTACLR